MLTRLVLNWRGNAVVDVGGPPPVDPETGRPFVECPPGLGVAYRQGWFMEFLQAVSTTMVRVRNCA